MDTHTRSDSSRLQLTVPVRALDGSLSRITRSTGTVDSGTGSAVASALRKLASNIHTADWHQTRRNVEDVFLAAGLSVPQIIKDPLPVLLMVRPFTEEYLARKKGKMSTSHYALLQRCLTPFARKHAAMELVHFKGMHVQAWADGLRGAGLAPGSIRNKLACVSGMFRYAVSMGHLSVNPCAGVDVPDAEAAVVREPMADTDFEKLCVLLREKSPQWLTVAMLGRYAGLRLADAAAVRAEDVSFSGDACLLAVTPGKTQVAEVLPVFAPLSVYLRSLAITSGCLAPSLAKLSPSCLSKQFCGFCDAAGVDGMAVVLPNGRTHRRVSFHALRHSFVLWLIRLGVPEYLRMKMSAHVTKSSHQRYDHATGLDIHKQAEGFFKA